MNDWRKGFSAGVASALAGVLLGWFLFPPGRESTVIHEYPTEDDILRLPEDWAAGVDTTLIRINSRLLQLNNRVLKLEGKPEQENGDDSDNGTD